MAQQPLAAAGVPRAWEFEECTPDELAALEAVDASVALLRAEASAEAPRRATCAQPSAPPPPRQQQAPAQRAVAPPQAPPPLRATVSCEAVSVHAFVVRAPREAAAATLHALGPVASAAALAAARTDADGGLEVPLPLACYERVEGALERGALLPPRRRGALAGDNGRVPGSTLAALRTLARREQPGTAEHAKQARAPPHTLPRRTPERVAAPAGASAPRALRKRVRIAPAATAFAAAGSAAACTRLPTLTRACPCRAAGRAGRGGRAPPGAHPRPPARRAAAFPS
jgi:hypothetical protein